MLLIGAGLMIRSFLRLQRVDPRFEPDRVLTAQIVLPQSRYREAVRVGDFHQQLLRRTQGLPGVQSASLSMALPPNLLIMRNPYVVEGPAPAPGQSLPTADQLLVSPDYFRTLGIRINAGRSFTDADNSGRAVRHHHQRGARASAFPPAGSDRQADANRRLQPDRPYGLYDRRRRSDDVKYNGLHEAAKPTIYTPFQQNLWWRSMYLSVKDVRRPDQPVNSCAQ